MWRVLLLSTLGLAACGYRPPPGVDTAASAYQTDLAACESSVPGEVNRRNAKWGMTWIASPVRRWGQIADGVQACMAGKGYGRVRACTEEERRAPGNAANRVVTASGVQCVEPPRPR